MQVYLIKKKVSTKFSWRLGFKTKGRLRSCVLYRPYVECYFILFVFFKGCFDLKKYLFLVSFNRLHQRKIKQTEESVQKEKFRHFYFDLRTVVCVMLVIFVLLDWESFPVMGKSLTRDILRYEILLKLSQCITSFDSLVFWDVEQTRVCHWIVTRKKHDYRIDVPVNTPTWIKLYTWMVPSYGRA